MRIEECIQVLVRRGYIIERGNVPDQWLVFAPDDPREIANGGDPDFFDTPRLIRLVEQYLIELADGDCTYHPYIAHRGASAIDCDNDTTLREAFGMDSAYSRADPSQRLISMDDWLRKHRGEIPVCPVCHQDLNEVGDLSTNVKTHFSHFPRANCPTMASAGKAYEIFERVPKGSDSDARAAKQYVLDHFEEIYEKARSICPELTRLEFLPLIAEATRRQVWKFKNFDPCLAAYVLLCCAEKFQGRRGSKRPHTLFFALEPGAQQSDFWHIPGPAKQRIWRVDATTHLAEKIQMTAVIVEPWYLRKARISLWL